MSAPRGMLIEEAMMLLKKISVLCFALVGLLLITLLFASLVLAGGDDWGQRP